jgi:hypothetical protein
LEGPFQARVIVVSEIIGQDIGVSRAGANNDMGPLGEKVKGKGSFSLALAANDNVKLAILKGRR